MNDWRNPWGRPPEYSRYSDRTMDERPYPSLARYSNGQPQQNTPSAIPGRIVEMPEEIKAQEIPMDGTLALFPRRDLSCIYAYQWVTDHVESVRYIPDVQQKPAAPSGPVAAIIPDEFRAEIFNRLDKIDSLVSGIVQSQQQTTKTVKKEEKASG